VKRLAASLAAEEEKSFTEVGEQHFTSAPSQVETEIDEDEDDDGEMIFVSAFSWTYCSHEVLKFHPLFILL
jgi:hypothetical protein